MMSLRSQTVKYQGQEILVNATAQHIVFAIGILYINLSAVVTLIVIFLFPCYIS